MVRMVVTDLDKTLLRSDASISDHTVDVLRACRAKGIKVVFATARSTRSAARFCARFTPDVFIGYGGALATAGGETIHRVGIPADISSQLIKDFLSAPEVTAIYAIHESVALTNRRDALLETNTAHYQYADFMDTAACGYLKISINATCQAAVEKIATRYPLCDMLRYTGEDLYRFAHRDAVKWNAVTAVAKRYGISTEELAAFGDDRNDLEMIANCGVGVAVDNAIDAVKAVAGFVCGANDEDGVSAWLEAHVLKP